MRDVEGLAGLVETERFGVFGENLLQVEPRRLQEVAHGVLIFEPVHPTLDGASLRSDAGDILAQK